MITISLCMIVKNEEDVLKRCLDSAIDLVDELILVDTGSSDATKEIAAQFTDKVYDFEWRDDFAAARNFSFSKATGDYCMWLDADDVILEEDRKAFLSLKENLPPDVDVIMMPYHTAFDENGNVTFLYYRERVVRNSEQYRWDGEVHEAIVPSGKVIYANASVTHRKIRPGNPKRNLRILEKKYASGGIMPPRQLFYYGQELYFNKEYRDAVAVLTKFLGQPGGWVENQIEACKILSFCYEQEGEEKLALSALLKSLEFDTPRAELCCELGRYFLIRANYLQAIFWYELALTRPKDETRGGFVLAECYEYIPALQLAVCYDRMGQWQKACEYNERAAKIKPDSEAVNANRAYFENKLKQVKGENNNEL